MNYSPKNHNDKFKLLDESKEGAEEIKGINFDKIIDSSIEGAEDFASEVEKAVSKEIEGVVKSLDSLKKELLSDIEIDFTEKLELYSFLVKNKIEEEETFPFSEWYTCADNKVNNLLFNHKQILQEIGNIHDVNADLGKYNLAEYLVAIRNNIKYPEQHFKDIESFINTRFPKANILDVFAASSGPNVVSGLNGEYVELNFLSKLFFQYAANLPTESWPFKKSKVGLVEVDSSTSNFDDIFNEFSKREIWNRISKNEKLTQLFIKEMITEDRSDNQFYKQRMSHTKSRAYQPDEIKWNVAKAFVDKVLKDDIKMTEFFVEKLISVFPITKKELFAHDAIKLVNIAVYNNLYKELKESNKEEKKKSKI